MNAQLYYNVNARNKVTPVTAVKQVTDPGTPEPLSADDLFCSQLIIYGRNGTRVENTDTVWLGWTATNGQQAYEITAGSQHIFKAPEGARYNLKEWYLDVTVADEGVVFIYE